MGATVTANPLVIVGLGNPGPKYAFTRHNVGFMVVDRLSGVIRGHRFRRSKGVLEVSGHLGGQAISLVKPQLFMNRSGEALFPYLRSKGGDVQDLLVIYDDLDLPLGRIRIKSAGGSGGHKGVQSIIDCMGSSDFWRIRIGIGRPAAGSGITATEYVLQVFDEAEFEIVDRVLKRVVDAIRMIINQGLTAAMNRFNRDNLN